MRENWQLIAAIVIIGAWCARLLTVGPGIGKSLMPTSAGCRSPASCS